MPRLIVRLPNHLGDVCMTLPALDLLAARGFDLMLVGKAWARPLFGAYDWPVEALAGDWWHRRAVLRSLRSAAAPGMAPAIDALLFTNSFSSALEFRLAGVRAIGYVNEARGWLLADAVPLPDGSKTARAVSLHMVDYYYRLAAHLTGSAPDVPNDLHLRLSPRAGAQAEQLRSAAGATGPYVMVCPVAVGLHRGRVKAWDGFGRLATDLTRRGVRVLACPGPGEHEAVVAAVPAATVLPSTDVATFGALLAQSELVVANDSGPGHLAAAVGARLVSVFGVTEPARTRPWGSRVHLVGGENGWPGYDEVATAVDAALAR